MDFQRARTKQQIEERQWAFGFDTINYYFKCVIL